MAGPTPRSPGLGPAALSSHRRRRIHLSTGYVWHELFGWADSGSGGLFPADPAAGLQPIGHHVAHATTRSGLGTSVELVMQANLEQVLFLG